MEERKVDCSASPTSSPPTPPSPLPISVGPGDQHYFFSPSPSPPSSSHTSAELLPLVEGKVPSPKVPSSAFFLDSRDPDYLDSKSSCLEDLIEWLIARCYRIFCSFCSRSS